ncbi:MAG TPA: hypothetical protein VKO16_10770, partial [Polyangia bacterium]|nr:hypothetical protein [Polyangia bacterium]
MVTERQSFDKGGSAMAVSSGRNEVPCSGGSAGDLLSQAAAILAREAGRLPLAPSSALPSYHALAGAPEGAGGTGLSVDPRARACPVTGATMPPLGADSDRLRKQAHELVAGLLTLFAPAPGNGAGPGAPTPIPGEL